MKPNRFSNDAGKPFHSHTYAEAENGSSMGSTSPETFNQRYRVDQNRQHIAKYRDSFVARSGHLREELNRRLGVQPSSQSDTSTQRDTPNRQSYNAGGVQTTKIPRAGGTLQVPKRGFTEPPTRNYNPFS